MMKREEGRGSSSYALKLNALQQNFHQSCLSAGQPLGYCQLLIESLNNKHYENVEEEYKFKMYFFADEINRIKKGESFDQEMNILMSEREQAIRQLRSQLINSRISKQLNLSGTCVKLESIRMYNLMVIQKVMKLSSELKINESTYFTELLQRVSEDGDFLRISALKNYIPFSNSRDPLFLVPLSKFWTQLPTEQMQRRPIIDLFNLDTDYQKRLQKANVFLQKMQAKDSRDVSEKEPIQDDLQADQQADNTRQAEIRRRGNNTDDISRSTLQKFILPSVNAAKKKASDIQRRNYVHNVIKDVINNQERDNNMHTQIASLPISPNIKKNRMYRSNEKSKGKRVELEKSVPRDARPQQIKYRFDRVHSIVNKQQKKVSRNQKLPNLNKSLKRPDANAQNTIDYHDEYPDVLENKAQTIDIMDGNDRRVRRNMGKIIRNYSQKSQQSQEYPQKLIYLSREAESPYRLIDSVQFKPSGRQEPMPKKIYFNTREYQPRKGLQHQDDRQGYNSRAGPKIESHLTSGVSYPRLQNDRKVDRINKLDRLRESDRRRQQIHKNIHHNIVHQYDYVQQNMRKGEQVNSQLRIQQMPQKKEPSSRYEIMNQFDINSVSLSLKNQKRLKGMLTLSHVLQIKVAAQSTYPSTVLARDYNLRQVNGVQNAVVQRQGSRSNQPQQQELTSSQGSSVVSPKFPGSNSNLLSLTSNLDPTVTFNNGVGKGEYPPPAKEQPSLSNSNQQIRLKTQVVNGLEGNQIANQYDMNNKPGGETNSNVSKSGSNLRREQAVSGSIRSKVELPFPENRIQKSNSNSLNNIDPVSTHSPNIIKYSNNATINRDGSHSSVNNQKGLIPASQSNARSQLLQGSQREGLLDRNVSFSPQNQNQQRIQKSNNSAVNSRAQQIQRTVPVNNQTKSISSPSFVSGRQNEAVPPIKKQNQPERYGGVEDQYQEPINTRVPAPSANSSIKINKNDIFIQGQSKGVVEKDSNYYEQPIDKSNVPQSRNSFAKANNNNESFLSGDSYALSNTPSATNINNTLVERQQKREVNRDADADKEPIYKSNNAYSNAPIAKISNNDSLVKGQQRQKFKEDVYSNKEPINKSGAELSNTPAKTNNINNLKQAQSKKVVKDGDTDNRSMNKNSASVNNPPSAKNNSNAVIQQQQKKEVKKYVAADKEPIQKSGNSSTHAAKISNNDTSIPGQKIKGDVNYNKEATNKSSAALSNTPSSKTGNENTLVKAQSKGEHKNIQKNEGMQPKPFPPKRLQKESQYNNTNNTVNPLVKQNTLANESNYPQQNNVANSKQNPVKSTSKTQSKQSSIIREPQDISKSKIIIPNPQASSNTPASTSVVQPEQIAITKQQAATLQKCVFQSKSISEQDLLKQIRTLSPNKYDALLAYLTASFFTHRHINLTNCVFNNEIACYCIYFPQITLDRRLLYILHIEVTQQKLFSMETQLISTFIKYIFTNDPCERIIYLRHTDLMSEDHKKKCQSLKNYAAQVKTPLKMPFLDQNSLCYQRKGITCKQSEKYTSVINTFGLFVCPAVDKLQFQPAKVKDFNIELGFLKKMQLQLASKQAHHFQNKDTLISYLQEQGLPLFERSELGDNLMFTSFVFEDCLLRTRFLVHSNEFFFTIDPPFSYLLENNRTYFVLMSTSDSKKFYVFGDKLYEQAQEIDLLKQFREKVMNKSFSSLCTGESGKGQVISCPLFKKQVEVEICPKVHTNFTVELNWKEYIKGVRYLVPDKISLELIPPFFCGMVEVDQSGNIQLLYSCSVTEDQTSK